MRLRRPHIVAGLRIDFPEVTRVGVVLQRLRLDQLPLLLNVLKGEMSFVGPQPYPAEIYERILDRLPRSSEPCDVKPGITGWAQVDDYRDGTNEIEQRLKRDLYYAKNRTFMFDLKILWMTLFSSRARRGSPGCSP